MDNHERRPRQSNVAGYAGPTHSQQHHPQQQHQPHPSGDRFQSTPAGRTPSNMPYPHAYAAPPGAGPGYPDIPAVQAGVSMPAGSMQYPAPDFPGSAQRGQAPPSQQTATPQGQQPGATNAQQQAAQGGTPYHQHMYGFQQTPQQPTPPSPYDNVQQYGAPPRQSPAAIDVLTNQFGVPQGYYVPGPDAPGGAGAGGPTSAPNTGMPAAPQAGVPQGYSHPNMSYTTQSPVVRDSMAYATGMAADTASAATGGPQAYSQAYTEQQPSATDMDHAYSQYQNELRRTFEHVRDGRLGDAGTLLMRISEWLLGNADNLGLVRDDSNMYGERLKLWSEFNTCWLSVFQRQKEVTIEMQASGHRQHPSAMMEYDQMEAMGKELVRLCDVMEKHGLVDYQMGVWEEEIITLITACLDLLEGAAQIPMPQSSSRRR